MLNKNNTLKLHRTHYSISEAAKILDCDEQDVIYIVDEKEISLLLRMCGRWSFSKHKVRDVDSFVNHINSLKKDRDGFSYISEFSLIKINEIKKDKKLVLASTKGYFKMPPKVKNDFIFYEGQFPEYPSLLSPAGANYSENVKYIQIDWHNDDGFGYEGEGYLAREDVYKLHLILNDDGSNDKYKSLSVAQKERHAVKRNQVLSVALYLYKEDFAYRKESAAALADLIFDRAEEFWPDKKEPPLSHPIISKLVSSIFKKPIFTKI
ncbi:hypothetical protein ACWL8E_003574 [Escherichia coli]|uniref:hypothetical protein n=1 Tax=Escherichia coli TaxID=562 RepID=UPI0017CDBB0E|nr:hypothetical protein [Escherichia coli]EEV6085251.1 hypothetical protein [Escherichia coli]EFD0637402.1 hypothetical protein [Escherichia coli]